MNLTPELQPTKEARALYAAVKLGKFSAEAIRALLEVSDADKACFEASRVSEIVTYRSRVRRIFDQLMKSGRAPIRLPRPKGRRKGCKQKPATRPHGKITPEMAEQIRKLAAQDFPLSAIAERFRVSYFTVWRVVNGEVPQCPT